MLVGGGGNGVAEVGGILVGSKAKPYQVSQNIKISLLCA